MQRYMYDIRQHPLRAIVKHVMIDCTENMYGLTCIVFYMPPWCVSFFLPIAYVREGVHTLRILLRDIKGFHVKGIRL